MGIWTLNSCLFLLLVSWGMLSQIRTVGSAVERFVDIEEVTGSIPVRSTLVGLALNIFLRITLH